METYENQVKDMWTKSLKNWVENVQNNQVLQDTIAKQEELSRRTKTRKWSTLRKILLEAVRTGNQSAVANAIKHGADVILWLNEPAENEVPCTFLGLAAQHGHHKLIDCLLKAGIKIEDTGGSDWTPLHRAVKYNHVEFAKRLIQAGANINATTINIQEHTPLHVAAIHGNLECADILLQNGANTESLVFNTYTALHLAAANNQLSIMELLLEAGCNRDACIYTGGTALHVAAMNNNKDAVELLIKRNFDPQLKDIFGHTPRESADIYGHESPFHWLDKSMGGNLNEPDLGSIGAFPSPEQMANFRHSLGLYNAELGFFFDALSSKIEYDMNVIKEFLKMQIPQKNSGYVFCNPEGLTILHAACKNGHLEIVRFLIVELELYPNIKTYHGDSPADVAKGAGYHKIVHYLMNFSKHKSLSIVDQMKLYEKLLKLITKSDNVVEASRLLTQGAPMESYAKTKPSALAMAIQLNRVKILELLLAAGAPLSVKHHGKTLQQLIWLEPDVTTRVKVIVTRVYLCKLSLESRECLNEAKKGLLATKIFANEAIKGMRQRNSMFTKLKSMKHKEMMNTDQRKILLLTCLLDFKEAIVGETPWKARWKIINRDPSQELQLSQLEITNNQHGLSIQMGIAVRHNYKLTSFFLQHGGGHPNHRTELGLTPLHEALYAENHDLAIDMVRNQGGSLYIPDVNGRLPADFFPTHIKEQLVQELVVTEFNELEESILKGRSEAERSENQEIALILVCLYAIYTDKWNNANCEWQKLHRYLFSLIQVKSKIKDTEIEEDISTSSQKLDYGWVTLICKNLNKLNKENNIVNEETGLGFLALLSCIEDLNNNFKNQGELMNLLQHDKNCILLNIPTNNTLLNSVKLSTENKFPIFLHLLFKIGDQSVDAPQNQIINSLPIHHAVAAGNFCAFLYLSLTCGALVSKKDKNGNTAAHLAYMYGYRYIGDYICGNYQNVRVIKNNAGQTPKDISEAFRAYEKLYDIVKDEKEIEMSVNLTKQVDGLALTYNLLGNWLSKNKRTSFGKSMVKSIVDYRYGEAKLVQSLMEEFAKIIGIKIAEYNPLLKGSLVPVGSAKDNVRLYAPDECDCTWILDWKNVNVYIEEMPKEDQNIKHYKHIIRTESDDAEIRYLLDGTNLLEEFYDQSVKAVSDIASQLHPQLSIVLPGVKRIGCGVCITFAWAGKTYPMLLVNMDLVPAFKAPRPANFPHPPLTNNKEDPRLNDIYIVQTHIQNGEKRCSTTLEEQFVMQNLSLGQHLVFIVAKLLVSKLKTEKWASKLFKERFIFFSNKQFKLPAPTGFLMKSAFFQELEKVKDPNDWKEDCIVDRLKSIFNFMCSEKDGEGKIHSGLVQSYFSSTTQPPQAGFMAPAIVTFLRDNEEALRKMEDSSFDIIETEEFKILAHMWDEALNKYFEVS